MHAKVIPFPARPSRLTLWLDGFARDAKVLWSLWALFFALRFVALIGPEVPDGRARDALLHAVGLASGHGYLDAAGHASSLGAPGWPIALSWVFAQFGASLTVVGMFNMVLAAISALMTLAFTRRFLGGEGAARFALLVLALCPGAILQVSGADGAALASALLLVGCWMLAVRTSRWHLVGAGLVLGFAGLTDPQVLAVVPAVFLIDALRGSLRRLAHLGVDAALLAAMVALTLTPWALRGHFELNHWTVIGTGSGAALLGGNAPLVSRADGGKAALNMAIQAARPGLNETARDAAAGAAARRAIARDPAGFAALAPGKLATTWLGAEPERGVTDVASRSLRALDLGFNPLLLGAFVLAFIAISVTRRRQGLRWADWWLLPYGTALAISAVAAVFAGDPAARAPALPWLCMAAGWLIAAALRALGARPRRIPRR